MMKTDSNIYNIYYDPALDAVVMEWNGYATSAQFRQGTEKMLEILIENKAEKVLGDVRQMVLIGMEDQKWLETDFLPRAIHQGFKVIAMIRPEYYFNKVAVETVSYKVDKEKLSIQFFDSREKASEWLKMWHGDGHL
jgi:hypothetical protein